MATQKDIAYTYDDLDEMWPLILDNPYADITCAYYNDGYSKSLLQAQRDKHAWIFESVGFERGDKLIDIGCGWGPMLNAVRERGGHGVGLTLSPKQAEACRRQELEVYLLDWKELDPTQFGKFKTVVSLGAFEHFCSAEEFLAGQQEKIYKDFFKLCYNLLGDGNFLYLQTMTWGQLLPWGNTKPTLQEFEEKYATVKAPKFSDEWILGYLRAFFPGSWLPDSKEQIVRVAAPYFELVNASDGRLDYIQTITEWLKAWYAPKTGKTWVKLKLLPNLILQGRPYWHRLKSIEEKAAREVFIRNIFGHQRMFFRKR